MYKIKIIVFIVMCSILCSNTLSAKENDWNIFHFKLYFENDMFAQTDSQYSSGVKFNLIYHVNNPDNMLYDILLSNDLKEDIYTSFSLANQLYTPVNLAATRPIYYDRSYAAWTYLEMGIHKSTKDSLNTILLKVGMLGPSAKGEEIQTKIHEWVDSEPPMGWDNQLHDELGINLSYMYKWRYEVENESTFGVSFIPSVEADLGNISTQASVGFFSRIGYNIPKDFGISTLDVGGESGIPVYDEQLVSLQNDWSFSLNISATGSAVVKDIFLEGNTFKDSLVTHDANNFVGYFGVGISMRYKSLNLDFMQTYNTSKYENVKGNKAVGTLLATWLF